MEFSKLCLNCNNVLEGRSDKKYCDLHCKSSFQYKQKKLNESSFYQKVDKQLKNNRKILKYFNRSGKTTVRYEVLKRRGFDSNYFTHYWKNNNGDVYLFVYEYGFLKKIENGKNKCILITWQEYMNKGRG